MSALPIVESVVPLDGFEPEGTAPALEPGELRFVVLGKPQPAGSKRAFAVRRAGVPTGQIAVSDANPKAYGWKQDVAAVAMQEMIGRPLLLGPVQLSLTFFVARPKGHYGSGRNAAVLKPGAPVFPIVKPDSLKLARGTEDACTGTVWRDDSQVVDLVVRKRYGLPERCEVMVRPL